MDEACGWHRHGYVLSFRQGQAQILDRERHCHSGWVIASLDDLFAVGFVNPGIEQRISQHVECQALVDPALSQQRQHLAHAFKRGRSECIGSEFHKVRQCGIFGDHEEALA